MNGVIIWICGFVFGVLFHVPAKTAFKWMYEKVSSNFKKE